VGFLILFLRGRDRARQPKMLADHRPIFSHNNSFAELGINLGNAVSGCPV
jgi:hypothetical protein